MKTIFNHKEQEQGQNILEEQVDENKNLILHNDDIHTFDYVIETLIEVCGHNETQAEQCTFLVHYKGKCDVKKGSFNYLRPMKEELNRRKLEATIE